jgi:predicted nucleic acid-binding protein
MLTFVDAGILILAARGSADLSARALAVLGDPRRTFVASPFLKLEVLPKPSYFQRADEVSFYETFFGAVSLWIPASVELVEHAMRVASAYGLACVDALHVAAALDAHADELVTAERPTSPLFRVVGLTMLTIMEPAPSAPQTR